MTTNVIQPGDLLLDVLRHEIECSSEIVVLAALVTDSGVQSVLKSIRAALSRNARFEFIFGIGMPASSSPQAIEKLFELHDDNQFKLLWYKGTSFFHPKVFLFRERNSFSALVGSSNFTEGGFRDNIEFNCYLKNAGRTDQAIKEILNALPAIRANSAPIDTKWLKTYSKVCAEIRTGRQNLTMRSTGLHRELAKHQTVLVRRWDQIVAAAAEFKKTPAYRERLSNISGAVLSCKKTIGKAADPDVVVARWRHKSNLGLFGTMDSRQFSKTIPTTNKEKTHLNRALRHLLDRTLPISKRLNDVLYLPSPFHVTGMGMSMASDILNKYFPDKCIVYNAPIVKALQSFGLRFLPSNPSEAYLSLDFSYTYMKKPFALV